MTVSRRELLKIAALAAASAGTLPLSGCESITSSAGKWLGEGIPAKVGVASGAAVDPDFHFLSRATYGLWPGDLDYLKKLGREKWLNEQLNYRQIDDRACDLRAQRFETLWLDPGTCFEYKKPVLRDELVRHMLLRAVYSKRQLYEVMVGFWSDHLNIDVGKGDAIYAKATDDRTVIRAHAFGRFQDLIAASAKSAAMLIYLDGKENCSAAHPTANNIPNENYARELLELHTMGVDGGYTQRDVYEVARCLTGWRIHTPWQRGKVYFEPSEHDDGAKLVLGKTIAAGGGEHDLDAVLNIVCKHKSTARHIATKLLQHFVSEEPPAAMVDKVANVFKKSDGDVPSLLRAIFTDEQFDQFATAKIKRPFHFIASSLRSLAADTYAHSSLTEYLNRMGHAPFQYPTPDGYPDQSSYWLSTLLWRWNFALSVCSNKVPEVTVQLAELATAVGALEQDGSSDKSEKSEKSEKNEKVQRTGAVSSPQLDRMFSHFVGRLPTKLERKTFFEYLAQSKKDVRPELVGLILSSPAFQRC
jgi:uncharacterized protein (DUF1800 family)